MRTTTKPPKTSTSDLDDRCLQRASVFIDSALAAHRDGSEPRAFSCAESAAARLSSYIDRTALKLGVKPLACVKPVSEHEEPRP